MKNFVQIRFANGLTYQVPMSVIADDRAASMFAAHPDEFPTLDDAMADTKELFAQSTYDVQDWACNNMNWEQIEPHAKLIRAEPPAIDWTDSDNIWSMHEHEAIIGDVDGDTALKSPLMMILTQLAEKQQRASIIGIETTNPDGSRRPYAMIMVALGNQKDLETMSGGIGMICDALDKQNAVSAG